ncbi:MAG: TolC family protein [Saprospiraceae bacterium]|nr:TolC family protein [Candidatus Vicinibacter affinis]
MPDLNGNINMGWSIGRNIDPTSNDFITQDILNGNYGLSSSVILFQAGLVNKSINQSKINLTASKEEYQQTSNDIALQVASQYLNVLLADERLEIAGKNLEAIRQQMEQIQKMISAGGRPEADLYEIKSQVARSEQGVVSAENALDLAWLSLKQSLRLRSDLEMSLEPLSEEQLRNLESESYTYENLYEYSSVNQPGMKAAKLRLEAAKLGEGMARAAFFPSLLEIYLPDPAIQM